MGNDHLPQYKQLPPRDSERVSEGNTTKAERVKNEARQLRKDIDLEEKPIPWGKTVFDGFGKVEWDKSTNRLSMSPKASTLKRKNPEKEFQETHAALVVSNESFKQPFQFTYTIKTTKQLRQNEAPNNWEVGWAVFGYKDDGKFKYTILKPKGFEMGESLLKDAQEFLYSSETEQDQFPINQDYSVEMKVENNTISITVNGKKYPSYKIFAKGNKDQLTADGKLGFYTEDATIQVSNIKMKQL